MDQLAESSLVELAKAGDRNAFAELYNRYFDPVYDFAARMTRDRDEAADIAQDTFLKAMNALGGLRKEASFKSWIFTIARNTALNQLKNASRTRPLTFEDSDGEEAGFGVVDTGRFSGPEEAARAGEIASLVWEAAAGLDPRQLSLLDLHLRQGLDSGEIAGVLGVTRNNGYVMLNRLKKAVEEAIGAFIMFKTGRQYCPGLDALLGTADIQAMSPETRKLVSRHVAQCPECEERKKKLAPLAVFAAFGAIGAPAGARAHILEGLLRQWPGPAATAAGAGPAGPGGGAAHGGPGPADSGGRAVGRGFLRVGSGLVALAAVLVALLIIPQSPIALTRDDGGAPIPAGPSQGPGSMPPPGEPFTPVPGRSPAPAPSPGASPTASSTAHAGAGNASPTATQAPPPAATPTQAPNTPTPAPTRTSTPTATPARTPTPTPTPTKVPCFPVLQPSTTALEIPAGGFATFVVTNSEPCDVAFTVGSQVFSGGAWLSASPAGGTIPAGAEATVTVSVDAGLLPAGEGAYYGYVTVQGPNNSFTVQVTATRGGQPPAVQSITGQCMETVAGVSFTAIITDDVAVGSAIVSFTASGGTNHQVELRNTGGNTWAGSLTGVSARAGTNFRVVATDASGKQTARSFTAPC